MDINYCLHREQIERVRAATARSDEARLVHGRMADLYRERIEAYRAARAAGAASAAGRAPAPRISA